MLRAEIIVPKMRFGIENEEEVIRAMAAHMLLAVKNRLRRGISAQGTTFPNPKDGGRPLQRSNQLLESIIAKVTRRGRSWEATIEPSGMRSDARDRAAAIRRGVNRARRALTRTLRLEGKTEDEIKSATRLIRGRRNRSRNMDVAAILAYAPKDKRARNGNRGRYDLFATTETEKKELARLVARVARFALIEDKTGARHRGRGEAP